MVDTVAAAAPVETSSPQQEELELNFRLDGEGRTAAPTVPEAASSGIATTVQKTVAIDYTSRTIQTSFGFDSPVKEGSEEKGVLPNTDETSVDPPEDSTQTFSAETSLDELLLDCEIADSGLMPRTFWVAAEGQEPRCSLEQMAIDVFRYHTKQA